jgi:succinylglutamate desuccinylase
MQQLPPRLIGQHQGSPDGPAIIAFGGLHGNETAGVRALEKVLQLLEDEPTHNPDFQYRGHFLAIRGNRHACAAGVRFLEKDLNRQWTMERIARVKAQPIQDLRAEDWELRELTGLIDHFVAEVKPSRLIILDIHTTTAYGGIFTIATEDPSSVELAKAIQAPVITGMLTGLQGTTLHYFNDDHFPCPTVAITFEAGQHHEPKAVDRSLAAIISVLRTVGAVGPEDLNHQQEDILAEYSQNLPKVAQLRGVHRIRPQDNFHMRAGFHNFQRIKSGTLLAHDRNGPIISPYDATLLMPLYQSQGEDGFFLIEEVEK